MSHSVQPPQTFQIDKTNFGKRCWPCFSSKTCILDYQLLLNNELRSWNVLHFIKPSVDRELFLTLLNYFPPNLIPSRPPLSLASSGPPSILQTTPLHSGFAPPLSLPSGSLLSILALILSSPPLLLRMPKARPPDIDSEGFFTLLDSFYPSPLVLTLVPPKHFNLFRTLFQDSASNLQTCAGGCLDLCLALENSWTTIAKMHWILYTKQT